MSDHDHDLLITVSADVKHLVKSIEEIKSTMGGFAKELPLVTEKVNTQAKDKVTWTQLWGLIILLTGIVGGTFAYNFTDDSVAHAIARENKVKIELNKGDSAHVDIHTDSN